MHYLIVAKVKDYPDFNKFVFGLSRQTYILNDHDRDYGKWKDVTDEYCIYWRHSTMFAHYIAKVVMRRLEAEKEVKELLISAFSNALEQHIREIITIKGTLLNAFISLLILFISVFHYCL